MEEESGELGFSSTEKPLTFSEYADEMCAYYMSIGVSYDEYWHGNYARLRFHHKAFEQVRDRTNYNAWLQGAYVYDAICAASPILHGFAKKGTKPLPYHKEPYGMKLDEASTDAPEKKQTKTNEEIQALNASAKFASFMTQWNKRFESKGGEANGANS